MLYLLRQQWPLLFPWRDFVNLEYVVTTVGTQHSVVESFPKCIRRRPEGYDATPNRTRDWICTVSGETLEKDAVPYLPAGTIYWI